MNGDDGRGDIAAVLFLAVLAAAVLSDALFSGGRLVAGAPFNDMPAQFLAWRDFGFSQLRAGHLALWNPHSFSGAAFFGAFESALLYPPNWVHLFLSPGAAIDATLWLHLFLAGLLTYAWSRQRGARGFEPRREVVLESDPGLGAPGAGASGEAVVVSSDAAGCVVAAHASSASILLVTDAYARAWRARPMPAGGPAYRVMPADAAFIGIPLQAGDHVIRLDYEPLTLRWGLVVSLLAWAGCLAWAFRPPGRGSAS